MSLLAPPHPDWPLVAEAECAIWRRVPGLVAIHHIGSTSVPGLPAKPVVDLLPVFADAGRLDAARPAVEAMGYEWLGEYGLPGRRYCRRNDAGGVRRVQAHAYPSGSPRVAGHLAFRDWLRADPRNARAYAREKARCAALYPGGGARYGACKSAWVDAAEARATEAAG